MLIILGIPKRPAVHVYFSAEGISWRNVKVGRMQSQNKDKNGTEFHYVCVLLPFSFINSGPGWNASSSETTWRLLYFPARRKHSDRKPAWLLGASFTTNFFQTSF